MKLSSSSASASLKKKLKITDIKCIEWGGKGRGKERIALILKYTNWSSMIDTNPIPVITSDL